ncbi:sigma-70 family RNA polymerase sigma factor [Nakamurella flavida]|uniref:Sigma-70 family RNA polymerase sigma factor n=1 Tax=Nakamurella flavida TaxID=363630 RepID=A0A938YEV9_9ACTN|nr:sigma-70 family RNA polymerase sigma factor [Nakamurella flavida]MBM9476390.1 sigma-70 family RNA polymerase sigma factor [Nakamurella flavida]MDP9779509.1 RNA polymerase sigma-70 factor (ECF subfamily) [Nakamurella flavida]
MTTTVIEPGPALTLDVHRPELTGYCYRMLGSAFDAEDAVQETMIRAYRALDRFEGRSSLRTWLYKVATNVCLDSLNSKKRRARPMDLSDTSWQPVEASLAARHAEDTWLEPMVDSVIRPVDPADAAVGKESIRLAFVAALQYLPARQRVVLILRDVLNFRAAEVAELLETTVASVNSALQRAHATLAERPASAAEAHDPLDARQQDLLRRYVTAFEDYDMEAFLELLQEDATQNMPPFAMWLQGRDDVVAWMLGPGGECRGSRILPTVANGQPAFAQYRPSGPDGRHEPWALHVLDVREGRIAGISSFLDTGLWPLFGLPANPDGD